MSTKRGLTATASTPTPRKRVKINNDVSTRNSSASRRRSDQATLTQIDFIKNVSPQQERDVDLSPIEAGVEQPQARARQRRLMKRDSTLTQMDFFNPSMDEGGYDFDNNMMLPETSRAPHLSVGTPLDSAFRQPTQPKKDTLGTRPQSAKRDRSRTSPAVKRVVKQHDDTVVRDVSDVASPGGGGDHNHSKRRKLNEKSDNTVGLRRRSGRLAAANRVENRDFAVGVVQPRAQTPDIPCDDNPRPIPPPLLVRDSTDFVSQPAFLFDPGVTNLQPPATPPRGGDRIPSSQTPESLEKPTVRKPLKELSTNVRTTPSGRPKSTTMFKTSSPTKDPNHSRKCTLKVPSKALLPRAGRVDDSQRDVWSIQATSSQGRAKSSPRCNIETEAPEVAVEIHQMDGSAALVESTTSKELDTQKSLPDICDLFRVSVKHIEEGINLPAQGEEMLFDNVPRNMVPEFDQDSTDELSDFGSPVANDTQFVRHLQQRISSPAPGSEGDIRNDRAITAPVERHNKSSSQARDRAQTSVPASSLKASPLPVPRLVSKSPAGAVQQQGSRSTFHVLTYSPTQSRSQIRSSENTMITMVPLNDTTEYQKSSSSPLLPPALFSVHKMLPPASIPHPSQVSTQAPSTQGFFPTSSMLQLLPVPNDTDVDRIVIKDSSSVPARLSQFPQLDDYEEDDLDEDGDVQLVDDDDDENGDDFDLDPSTFQRGSVQSQRRHKVIESDNMTQTPTQGTREQHSLKRKFSNLQESPIVTIATTRAERDARLEVIALPSSSQPQTRDPSSDDHTPKMRKRVMFQRHPSPNMDLHATTSTTEELERNPELEPGSRAVSKPGQSTPQPENEPPSSSLGSLYSPSPPRPLARKYSPLEGFDNDTQSDFTQGGHVTAAYIHRLREDGVLKGNYVPKPYKVKNWKPSMYTGSKRNKQKVVKDKT